VGGFNTLSISCNLSLSSYGFLTNNPNSINESPIYSDRKETMKKCVFYYWYINGVSTVPTDLTLEETFPNNRVIEV
jgi:hypothetical protein